MRFWNQIDDTVFFNMVFSYPAPIDEVELFSISIDNDRPQVVVLFDIPYLPDRPPKKWENYNRCRSGLVCLGVDSLLMKNIPIIDRFSVSVSRAEEVYHISFSNSSSALEFRAKFISLSGPSVYLNEAPY